MGADLYIMSLYEPACDAAKPAFDAAVAKRNSATTKEAKEAAQVEVDAAYDAMTPEDSYFRDSYNVTSVLNRCGLSWWQDVSPMLNRKGDLSPQKALDLALKIESADLELLTLEQLIERGADVERGADSWHDYYRKKRDRLVAFLKHAASIKKPVHCSL